MKWEIWFLALVLLLIAGSALGRTWEIHDD
jgi:hypothetical protein